MGLFLPLALLALLASETPPAAETPSIQRMSVLEQRSGWRTIWDGKSLHGWTVVRAKDCAPSAQDPGILDGWLVASPSSGVSLRIAEPLSDCEISCDYRSWDEPELHCNGLRVWIEGVLRPRHEAWTMQYIENQGCEITPWSLLTNPARNELWDIALEPGFHRHAVRNVRLRDLHNLPGRDVPLFDGKSLDAFHPVGAASFALDDTSVLAQTSSGKQNSFLVTNQSFGDFLLTLELKNESPGNSGIQIRSRVVGDEPKTAYATGYQIEIDPSARSWSGGLYEERGRGWLQNLEKNEAGRKAFHPGEWNRYRIECIGPWIRAWVNDVPTADAFDPDALAGIIGLQVHTGQDTKVRFRRFQLHDFGQHAWKAADLKTLASDGLRLGNDFGLRLTRSEGAVKTTLAGWRLCFRGESKTPTTTSNDLLTPSPTSWSISLDHEQLAKSEFPGRWKELTILAYGDRIVLHRDHQLLMQVRPASGPDGPLVWIEKPAAAGEVQPFERVESIEPVAR